MLKESVERLNINISNSDFRKNASNVIAAMLEARVNKQQPPQSPPRPLKKSQQQPQKQPIPPPPSILKKPQPVTNHVDPEFLPPPPPICEDLPFNSTTKLNRRIYDQTDFKDDLPLPPPPSILTPPLSSDENDVPQTHADKSNGIEKVNLRNKKYHHTNGHNHQSSVGSNDSSDSANGGNKFELSSHARDRRSYIEKLDNQLTNIEGDELDVSKIANGLANGQNPVCDKCKCKITR